MMEEYRTSITAWACRRDRVLADCGEDLNGFLATWPEVVHRKMTAYRACAEVVLELHKVLGLAYIDLVIAAEEYEHTEKDVLREILKGLLKGVREALRTAQESRMWLKYSMVLDPTNDRDVGALRSISHLGRWIGETSCGTSALMVELDEIAARQLECDGSE